MDALQQLRQRAAERAARKERLRRLALAATPAAPAPAAAAPAPVEPTGGCPLCHGLGAINNDVFGVYCGCAYGKNKHDRELAMAWPGAEIPYIVALLTNRAERAAAPARAALLAAAKTVQEASYGGRHAITYLRNRAQQVPEARAELDAAAEALHRGEHLPAAPPGDLATAKAAADIIEQRATRAPAGARAPLLKAAEEIGRLAYDRGKSMAFLQWLAPKEKDRAAAAELLYAASDLEVLLPRSAPIVGPQ